MTYGTCVIDDCSKPTVGRGWCRTHYQRWYKWGDPLITKRIIGDDVARFWQYVDKTGEHWLWTAAKSSGYGLFRRPDGHTGQAHRYAYELEVGPIPKGLQLDHLCRVRACVRPDHLEPVDNRTNSLRGGGVSGINFARTECIHGHAFTAENTYVKPDGGRQCKTCRRAIDRRRGSRRTRQAPELPLPPSC